MRPLSHIYMATGKIIKCRQFMVTAKKNCFLFSSIVIGFILIFAPYAAIITNI